MSTDWPIDAQAHLAARLPIAPRWMVWTMVRPVAGGAAIGFGFWGGDDHEYFTIESQSRLYYGAQGAMAIDPISYEPGLTIATLDLRLGLTTEGLTFVRAHHLGGAPVEVHCALYNPANDALLGIRRYFKGWIDKAPQPRPARGQVMQLPIRAVSTARMGTMTIAGKKSDASQRQRDDADRFREYSDLGEIASDPWGGK